MPADPSNPFHQASFYLEQLKYGPQPGTVQAYTAAEIGRDLEALMRDAHIIDMSGAELVETLDYYAASLSSTFRLPAIIAKTLFTDGVMHGIAFAAGLKGEPR